MALEQFLSQNQWVLWLVLIWTLPWKGVALWKAVKNGHKNWFIVLLILNTLAVLDIAYIFIFSKKSVKLAIEENKKENAENPLE